jgi:hypothetical protein
MQTHFLNNQGPLARYIGVQLGDVAADYVFAGSEVQWVADVAVHGAAAGFYEGVLNALGLVDWQGYWNALKAAIEAHGFVNVSGGITGWTTNTVNLTATTPVDFSHAPDIRNLFAGLALQVGLDSNLGQNELYVLRQGPGQTGNTSLPGNPIQLPPSTIQTGTEPGIVRSASDNFFSSLGLTTPAAVVVGGVIALYLLTRK